MPRRRGGLTTAMLVAGTLLLSSCAADTRERDGRPSAATPVEFRRVLSSSQLDGGCRTGAAVCGAWARFRCPGEPQRLSGDLLMACGVDDEADRPYLLAEAEIVGGVVSAEATRRERIDQWEVEVELDEDAADAFDELTAALVPTSAQLAIVLRGTVVSAPAVQTRVSDGVVRLAGDYAEADAESLAARIAP